ncbi:MAG: Formyl-CoA transferase, partial [Dehalococcoidia bacterium]|nr:Formyl-CoA transferase [Dehalococcoidia bacterium]
LHPDILRANPFGAADGIYGLNRTAGYNCLNYAKKSVSIDLQTPEGVELAKRIIMISDVVTDSFAYGVMQRYGLDYEELKKLKPELVVMSKSTMGHMGRERHLFGWGTAVISYAGLASVTGYGPGDEPRMVGGTWPDYVVGIYSAFALLSAIYNSKKTGEGVFIDNSMAEGVISMMPEAVLEYTMNGRVTAPRANRDERMAPNGVYRCQGDDKWVAISVSNNQEWEALCQTTGHSEWLKDDRFVDLYSRQRHYKELDALITEWTKPRTNMEVTESLQRAGVAAGPCYTAVDVCYDPHLRERGQFVEMDHPEVGPRMMPTMPVHLSALPDIEYQRSPLLGEHNDYVFSELLKMSQEEIGQLVEEGVIR